MSIAYFVHYEGRLEDLEKFSDYYRNVHAEIVRRFPNIKSLEIFTPAEWTDPLSAPRAQLRFLAKLEFDSVEQLNAAMNSAARVEARKDVAGFAFFSGSVLHQAMVAQKVF